MQKHIGMLYNGRQEIGLNELARINTALLTTCDFLYVNANYTVSQSNFTDYEHIRGILDTYIGEGIIRLWDYPGCKQLDGVITLSQQDYTRWAKNIESNQQKEEVGRLDKYLEKISSSLERSSMLVDIKKELWHYAVCNMLKADQIMFTQLSKQIELGLSKLKEYEYATKQEPLVQALFEISQVNTQGLALLSAPEMKKQIKQSKDFRSSIWRAQNGQVSDTDYLNRELKTYMQSMSKEYSQKLPSAWNSALGHGLDIAALLPGIGFYAGLISTTKNAVDDITSRTHDNKILLHFTARLAKITNKASKKR